MSSHIQQTVRSSTLLQCRPINHGGAVIIIRNDDDDGDDDVDDDDDDIGCLASPSLQVV